MTKPAPYTVCKVFTATTFSARDGLGERATAWLHEHPELEVVEARAVQSSDNAFHCLTIVLLLRRKS